MGPAAAAKSRQSCPTLRDPIDGSPPGSSVHGILQARVLEWAAIAFSEIGPGWGTIGSPGHKQSSGSGGQTCREQGGQHQVGKTDGDNYES